MDRPQRCCTQGWCVELKGDTDYMVRGVGGWWEEDRNVFIYSVLVFLFTEYCWKLGIKCRQQTAQGILQDLVTLGGAKLMICITLPPPPPPWLKSGIILRLQRKQAANQVISAWNPCVAREFSLWTGYYIEIFKSCCILNNHEMPTFDIDPSSQKQQ